MDITSVLIGMAAETGATLVKQILEDKFGPASSQLVDTVVKSIANQADTPVQDLPDVIAKSPDLIRDAIMTTEAIAPELVGLYTRGLDGQFALLQAETAEGPLQSGWRWGWMYLLGIIWVFYLLLFPILNAVLEAVGSSVQVKTLEASILLTLTSWFIALYMGGHTVKKLSKTALDAVRSWKEPH